MKKIMSKYWMLMLAAMLPALSSGVSAHTVWLEPEEGQENVYRVYFGGHADELEAYDAKKLISVEAYDNAGERVSIERNETADGVLLGVEKNPSLFVVHFHNGIHTRDAQGRSFELPMSEVQGARSATNTPKYHKLILEWSAASIKEQGQAFEVIPLDTEQPMAGQPMRVKVVINGAPAEGIRLGHGEEGDAGLTDAEGIATFTPRPGLNRMWAGKRFPVTDNPDYTELSYEYLLGFYAQ
jgi:nickel transport protein